MKAHRLEGLRNLVRKLAHRLVPKKEEWRGEWSCAQALAKEQRQGDGWL